MCSIPFSFPPIRLSRKLTTPFGFILFFSLSSRSSSILPLSPRSHANPKPVEYTRENGLPYAFDAVASSSNHNNNGDATTTLYMLGTSPGAASGVFSWAKPAAKAAESGATRSGNDEAVRLCSAMKVRNRGSCKEKKVLVVLLKRSRLSGGTDLRSF
jgi:hypothetical protein